MLNQIHYWDTNNDKHIFIFDEVDDLSNPISNQLNIVNCDLNSDEKQTIQQIINITYDFTNILYDIEETNKELYNNTFTQEKFYFIINLII